MEEKINNVYSSVCEVKRFDNGFLITTKEPLTREMVCLSPEALWEIFAESFKGKMQDLPAGAKCKIYITVKDIE